MKDKDQYFQLRLSDEDRKMLDVISDHHRRRRADMVRALIYQEYQRITSAPSPTAPVVDLGGEWGIKDD